MMHKNKWIFITSAWGHDSMRKTYLNFIQLGAYKAIDFFKLEKFLKSIYQDDSVLKENISKDILAFQWGITHNTCGYDQCVIEQRFNFSPWDLDRWLQIFANNLKIEDHQIVIIFTPSFKSSWKFITIWILITFHLLT